MNDLSSLTLEVRKIYKLLEYLRRNEQGQIEFGITTCRGDIVWFPYYRLPYAAEKYINSWLKLEHKE